MTGDFVRVWEATKSEIWGELYVHESAGADLYPELFRELNRRLKNPLAVEVLAGIVDDRVASRTEFEKVSSAEINGEVEAVRFFEVIFDVVEEMGGDGLSNHYFLLLEGFLRKYNLRYDLRRPCVLCPTLQGIFSGVLRDLRRLAQRDDHLRELLDDFEVSVRDLKTESTESRIRTCIQKQVNVMEALGRSCPDVKASELGAICNEVPTWPHEAVKKSLKSLYGFASDYPGIRHAGNPRGKARSIELRDFVAISILFTGFVPYLSHGFDSNRIYSDPEGDL